MEHSEFSFQRIPFQALGTVVDCRENIEKRQQWLVLPKNCLRTQLWFNQNIRSSIHNGQQSAALHASLIWKEVEKGDTFNNRYLSIEQRAWDSDSILFRKSFGHCRYGRRLEILSDRLPYSSSTYARRTWIYFYHSKSLVTRSFSRKFLSDLVQWTCRHPPAFSMGAWYKTLWILVIAMILTGIMRFCQYESYPAAFAKLSVLWPPSEPNLLQNCQQIENPCEQRLVFKENPPSVSGCHQYGRSGKTDRSFRCGKPIYIWGKRTISWSYLSKQTFGIFLLRRTGKERPLRLAVPHLSLAC